MSFPSPRLSLDGDPTAGLPPLRRAFERAVVLHRSAVKVGALYDDKARSIHPGMRRIIDAQRAILWIMEQVTDEVARVCRIIRRRQLRLATWRVVRHLGAVSDLDAPAEAHRLVVPLIEDAIDGIGDELIGLRHALAGYTSSVVVSGQRHTRHMASILVAELRELVHFLAQPEQDAIRG